jgi:nitroimidazol reductase NimA-like FMN-containing flavoprotein (pyridoxamine 5'-phosphate oxidase superfamily)
MTPPEPVDTKNLDGYGAPLIPWEKAQRRIEETFPLQGAGESGTAHTHWLATTSADGRPHLVPVGPVWLDGAYYFSAGEDTRKGRDLASNPRCVIGFSSSDLDVVVEGTVEMVTDEAALRRVAEAFASASGGWAPTVSDGAFSAEYSAPSAGPPPWRVYKVTPTTVFGLGSDEPYGATRWRFE